MTLSYISRNAVKIEFHENTIQKEFFSELKYRLLFASFIHLAMTGVLLGYEMRTKLFQVSPEYQQSAIEFRDIFQSDSDVLFERKKQGHHFSHEHIPSLII